MNFGESVTRISHTWLVMRKTGLGENVTCANSYGIGDPKSTPGGTLGYPRGTAHKTTENGQWTTEYGTGTMDNRKWTMDNVQ